MYEPGSLVLCMTPTHLMEVKRMYPNADAHLLTEYAMLPGSVSDPFSLGITATAARRQTSTGRSTALPTGYRRSPPRPRHERLGLCRAAGHSAGRSGAALRSALVRAQRHRVAELRARLCWQPAARFRRSFSD